jgi:hypothetical protein
MDTESDFDKEEGEIRPIEELEQHLIAFEQTNQIKKPTLIL